ncbi:MAG: S-layer family protein, partial [Cyanothece sp. SIO2G6]|nr:S-layer family protein [Cyanothece sp. SIO2G6]
CHILSETESGDGGDIFITLGPSLGEFLIMGPGSAISTSAGTNAQGGDGGNISLNARLIQAIPQGNSDIAANAFTGNGGNVSITTEGIFGLEPRTQNTPLSNITATSTLGIDGTININRLNTNPSQGLIELTTMPTEPPPIHSLCDVSVAGDSALHILGRGGIPNSPADTISSLALWEDWHVAAPQPVTSISDAGHEISDRRGDHSLVRPITEAQGWVKTEDRQVQLVAHIGTTASINNSALNPNCHHPQPSM